MLKPKWTTALPDWEKRIVARQSLMPCGPLFPNEAAEAMKVFGALRITDIPGAPTIDECCRDWIKEFAAGIFGAYDREAGRQLIRNFFLFVAKKNAKSTLAPAIMLTALIRNWRPSGEFIIIAPTLEIANNSFGPARDMVAASEKLSTLLHIKENFREIKHRVTGATLKVIAADNEAVSGKKASGVLIEELWLFGKRPHAENMLREAEGGLAARPEGFVISLSTQSDEPPAGVFAQRLNYFRAVRDGELKDPKSMPLIYEFPKHMIKSKAYELPENFYIPNPNLGASVDTEFLNDEFIKARRASLASLCSFAAKHLNVEIGIALKLDGWEGAEHWLNCVDEKLVDLGELCRRCDCVTIGIDGGGLDDLLGFAVIGREYGTRRWLLWSHAWAHDSVLKKRPEIVSKLKDFEAEGTLTIYSMPGDDVAELVGIVTMINDLGLLPEKNAIGVDAVGISEIVDGLELEGITAESQRIVAVTQGWKLINTIKSTARKLAANGIEHAGTQLMSWCVGNAKVELKGNAALITKQNAGSVKIDPLMALFNASALMAKNPEPSGSSVFNEEIIPSGASDIPMDAMDAAAMYQKARDNYAAKFLQGDDD